MRLWNAFKYSLLGLSYAIRQEYAFRIELALYVILLFVLFKMETHLHLKVVLLLCNTSVLVIELLNSAIERVVDRISTEDHMLSKQAKDMGSAAVFLSILATAGAWCYVILY